MQVNNCIMTVFILSMEGYLLYNKISMTMSSKAGSRGGFQEQEQEVAIV